MSRSVNKVTLLGRLGKDPELKYTPQGTAVCKFTVATGEAYTDKNGQKQETTEWHNVVIWEKLGEIANQYLRKGRQVYLEGRIATRSYEKDGEKKYFTEVVANQMVLLGDKDSSVGASYSGGDTSFPPSQNSSSNAGNAAFGNDVDDSNDVPF